MVILFRSSMLEVLKVKLNSMMVWVALLRLEVKTTGTVPLYALEKFMVPLMVMLRFSAAEALTEDRLPNRKSIPSLLPSPSPSVSLKSGLPSPSASLASTTVMLMVNESIREESLTVMFTRYSPASVIVVYQRAERLLFAMVMLALRLVVKVRSSRSMSEALSEMFTNCVSCTVTLPTVMLMRGAAFAMVNPELFCHALKLSPSNTRRLTFQTSFLVRLPGSTVVRLSSAVWFTPFLYHLVWLRVVLSPSASEAE